MFIVLVLVVGFVNLFTLSSLGCNLWFVIWFVVCGLDWLFVLIVALITLRLVVIYCVYGVLCFRLVLLFVFAGVVVV